VPGIFALDVNGDVLSVAIWPPDCAILLPAVDAVLVPLAQSGKQSEELAVVRWNEVQPVVQAHQGQVPGLARYHLAFEQWPADIAAFLQLERTPMEGTNGVSFDELLDEELVEAAREQ